MGRWEPDARGRLLQAALDLFIEQGYEATTAAQIAECAGLTKTTLFRHFADKREILFQGQTALISVVTAAVESAPEDATGPELLRAGVRALCDAHAGQQQDISLRIGGLISQSPELQERAAFKRLALTSALEAALDGRLRNRHVAGVLSDLGIRAYYEGFAAWAEERQGGPLPAVVLSELDALERTLCKTFPPP